MTRHPKLRQRRRGAIAPLTAILLLPLLALVAFAVDLGWITHTQNELQSAADAAALAGAAQLPDYYAPYYLVLQNGQSAYSQAQSQAAILTTAENSAKTYAKKYAGYNPAGDVASLTLADSDIEFGYTDSSGNYTPLPTYTGYPNTVKVTLRRDSTANGPLGLFFGRVLGVNTANLQATAAATTYAGTINSFQTTNPSAMAPILPVTYDVNHWNNFIKTGLDPNGNLNTDGNGNPVLAVYPSLKYAGDFGQLSLDQNNTGASTTSSWISYGASTADLQQDINAGLLPLSQHNPNLPPDWLGSSGLSSSTIKTAQSHVGQVYLLPLFKPVNDGSLDPSLYQPGVGSGSNYYYTIVQFVTIKIYSATDKSIVVQPVSAIVPDAVFTGLAPAGPPPSNSSNVYTTFGACKLTQ
jgi:Flp pilus assembly protein TadG